MYVQGMSEAHTAYVPEPWSSSNSCDVFGGWPPPVHLTAPTTCLQIERSKRLDGRSESGTKTQKKTGEAGERPTFYVMDGS